MRTDPSIRAPGSSSDEVLASRALVRGRDDLVATRVQLANQLRVAAGVVLPGHAAIFAELTRLCAAFIERYPTPDCAARLGPKRCRFLRPARLQRPAPRAELLERPAPAAAGLAGELQMDAKGELARCLAKTLHRLVEQIRLISSRIEHHVASFDDGQIMMSFPRAGRICAAQILAELGSVRERFDTVERFTAEAGVAPVTYESGKSSRGSCACNRRLRAALTCLADNSAMQRGTTTIRTRPSSRIDHPHARARRAGLGGGIWRACQDPNTMTARLARQALRSSN